MSESKDIIRRMVANRPDQEKLLEVARLMMSLSDDARFRTILDRYVDVVAEAFSAEKIGFVRERTVYGFERLVVDESELDSVRLLFCILLLKLGSQDAPPLEGYSREDYVMGLSLLLVGTAEVQTTFVSKGGST